MHCCIRNQCHLSEHAPTTHPPKKRKKYTPSSGFLCKGRRIVMRDSKFEYLISSFWLLLLFVSVFQCCCLGFWFLRLTKRWIEEPWERRSWTLGHTSWVRLRLHERHRFCFFCALLMLSYHETWSKILFEILGLLDSFSLAGVGQIM